MKPVKSVLRDRVWYRVGYRVEDRVRDRVWDRVGGRVKEVANSVDNRKPIAYKAPKRR